MTGRERALVVQALEALAAGDTHEAATVILALEDGEPARGERRCPLPGCSWRGWPGALEHHLLYAHGVDWDDVEGLVARAA